MIRFGISEILALVSEKEEFNDRVKILRDNDSAVLRHIFKLAFTPGVKWLLPEGRPPIRLNDLPGQQGNLFAEWRRFYLFFPGGNDNVKQSKRESVFIQVLESLDPKDANLICDIKDGIMPYMHVDAELINTAFPGLLPEQVKVLEVVETPVEVKTKKASTKTSDNIVKTTPDQLSNLTDDDLEIIKGMGIDIILESAPAETIQPTTKTTKKKAITKLNG